MKKDSTVEKKNSIRPWLIALSIVLFVLLITALAYFLESYHHVRRISYDAESDTLYD